MFKRSWKLRLGSLKENKVKNDRRDLKLKEKRRLKRRHKDQMWQRRNFMEFQTSSDYMFFIFFFFSFSFLFLFFFYFFAL